MDQMGVMGLFIVGMMLALIIGFLVGLDIGSGRRKERGRY